MVLFLVLYAFHIYILHSPFPHCTLSPVRITYCRKADMLALVLTERVQPHRTLWLGLGYSYCSQ